MLERKSFSGSQNLKFLMIYCLSRKLKMRVLTIRLDFIHDFCFFVFVFVLTLIFMLCYLANFQDLTRTE